MTTPRLDFHSHEWKFGAIAPSPRSTQDEDPLARVEIHRADRRSHR